MNKYCPVICNLFSSCCIFNHKAKIEYAAYHGHVNVACMQFHVNLLVNESFTAGVEVGADL